MTPDDTRPLTPSEQLLQWFTYDHLPDGLGKDFSHACAELAKIAEQALPGGAEKTAGLRKLLEAKDCFVRAGLGQARPK